jgi:flagellar biosynthesis/type III secretory pathway chaperone
MSAALEQIATELYAVLTEEYFLSGELLDVIGQEKQQLERGDQSALALSLENKHQLLDKLQAVTAQRLGLLQGKGLNTTPGLPDHWSASLSEFPALASQHAQLLDLVQKLREENQNLGHMLNRKSHFITRLLDRMKPDTGVPPVYQSNGSQYHDAGTRKLISV